VSAPLDAVAWAFAAAVAGCIVALVWFALRGMRDE